MLFCVIEGTLSLGGVPSLRDRLWVANRAEDPALQDESGPWRDHPDARVARVLRPDVPLDDFGLRIRSDDFGLRRHKSLHVTDGVRPLRVVLVGGDEVFGAGLFKEDTLAAQLEREWQLVHSEPGDRQLRCVPVGLPGWTLRNGLAFLGDHLDTLRPDVVVLVPSPESLSDTRGAGRDGTLSVQHDVFSATPLATIRRDALDAALDEFEASRGWTVPRAAWLLERDISPLSQQRFDGLARMIERLHERWAAPWFLIDDAAGVSARLVSRLDPARAALAKRGALIASLSSPPEATSLPGAVRSLAASDVSHVIDLADGRGASQVYGGLHGDGTLGASFVAGLQRDAGADTLRLRVAPRIGARGAVVLSVVVDGEHVGQVLVDGSAVDEIWSCPPRGELGIADVELHAEGYGLHDDGRRLVSVTLRSLGFE